MRISDWSSDVCSSDLAVGHHRFLHARWIGGAAALVDVEAVRVDTDRHHLGAQRVEHPRRHVVGSAVGAVDHYLEPVQAQAAREAALHELDVAAVAALLEALRTTELMRWHDSAGATVDTLLDLELHLVRQLEAVRPEIGRAHV